MANPNGERRTYSSEEYEEMREERDKAVNELSNVLESYQNKNKDLLKCMDEKKKLQEVNRDLKWSLKKKENECVELLKKQTETETKVNNLNDELTKKCSVNKDQAERISGLENELSEKNKEITDLTNKCHEKTKEREASQEKQKTLNKKMDWFIGCLNEDRFPHNVPPDYQDNDNCSGDGNEDVNKLNLIFSLTKQKCKKFEMAFKELEEGIKILMQKYKDQVISGAREIEDGRLNQLSNFTSRTSRRRYSEVTNGTNRDGSQVVEPPVISPPSSALTIQIPSSAPIDRGSLLTENQFPLLAVTSPIPSTPTDPDIQSSLSSPSSPESERDIPTSTCSAGGNGDDINKETNKNDKSSAKKKQKSTSEKEVGNHGFLCPHCKKSFRVPGVLQLHVTACHSYSPRKAVKRRSLPPPPPAEQSNGEPAKKTIKGVCPKCKIDFKCLAELKMHLKKKHNSKLWNFDDAFIFLDHCEINSSIRDDQVERSSEPPTSPLPDAENEQEGNSTANVHGEQIPTDPDSAMIENQQKDSVIEEVVHRESENKKVCSCRKRFKNQCYLKRHLNKMNKEKNYECTVCPSKFEHNYQLQSHCKIMHPQVNTTYVSSNDDDDGVIDVSTDGDHVSLEPEPGSGKSNGKDITNDGDAETGNDSEENDENAVRGLGLVGITVSHDDDDNGVNEDTFSSASKKGGTDANDGNNEIDDIECLISPEQNKLKCCWCPLTFSVESAAQAHAKSVHQGELAIAVKAENGGNFACQTCFHTFETEQELQEHLNTNHLTNV